MVKFQNRKLSKYKRKIETIENEQEHLREILPKLTKRDKDILLSIYYHRCLTTEQIAEIHFKYRNGALYGTKEQENAQANTVARRRIRKLYDAHLVDRFFIDVGENNGSSQAHIVLDSLGAKVISGILNANGEPLHWRYEMNEVRLPYLSHMVAINDFYLYLLRSARKYGHEVGAFFTENHTRYTFTYWGEKMTFNPDAYGQYFYGDEGFHFFLEVDRGTMTPHTFRKKHRRYTAFYESDEYLKYFKTFPLILTVTPTWERAIQLCDTIYTVDNTDTIWLFTSEELCRENVLGEIWIGKEKKPVGLIPTGPSS